MKKVRVLIVDDHEMMRQGTCEFLQENGRFEVVAGVATGSECMSLAERLLPDIVVMDITMPVLDGIEATKRLTALGENIRVVAFSCHDDAVHGSQMLSAGAAGYVCKSEGWAGLVRAIDAAMAGEVYISTGIDFPEKS
mgnify:CR=1 FL=1